MQPKETETFLIKYTKTAKEVDGKEVIVIDEDRTEQTTVAQLEAQKLSYQNAISDINTKLAEIAKL